MVEETEKVWLPALILSTEDKAESIFWKLLVISSLSTLVSLAFSIPFLLVIGPSEDINLVKESEYGSIAAIINTVIFLAIAVIATVVMLYFVRKRRLNIIAYIMIFLISYLAGALSMMFIPLTIAVVFYVLFPESLITTFILEYYNIIFIATGLIFFILAIISATTTKILSLRNAILFLTAVFIGILLGASSGLYTPIVLLAAFATYDIYTVYKGPLGKLMNEIIEESPIESSQRPLIVGLGDIAFFSMPVAYSLAYFDIFWTFIVVISIFIGFLISGVIFTMSVKKKKRAMMPGLPIPISFALAVILFRLFL